MKGLVPDDWFVYILRCADDTLYTGATNNLDKRIEAHNSGQGAKYTRGRTPVELVYSEEQRGRSEALRREYEIKQLNRREKIALIG